MKRGTVAVVVAAGGAVTGRRIIAAMALVLVLSPLALAEPAAGQAEAVEALRALLAAADGSSGVDLDLTSVLPQLGILLALLHLARSIAPALTRSLADILAAALTSQQEAHRQVIEDLLRQHTEAIRDLARTIAQPADRPDTKEDHR